MKTVLQHVTEMNNVSYKKFKYLPNLENPTGYVDKLQWLKVYDQYVEHVICCDKISVKKWISNKIGNEFAVPNWLNKTYPVVIKSNHGSGGVEFANNQEQEDILTKKVKKQLSKPYGITKGEWAYQYINPRIMKEPRLDNTDVDYKFHCVNGEVRFLQMFWDRFVESPKKESIIDTKGKVTGLHHHSGFQHTKQELFCSMHAFETMLNVAKEISKGWKYVRVDFYWANEKPYIGELTFWPQSGSARWKTKDDLVFGQMLDFDTTTKNELAFDQKFHSDLDKLYQKYS